MKTIKSNLIPLIFIIIIQINPVYSQISIGDTPVEIRTVVKNLDTPWEILWGPDNKIWITERYGRVSSVDPETGNQEVLLTIPDVHEESESGLLGMVLHPSFPTEPYVYLVYNFYSGGIKERVVRYTYSNDTLADPLVLLDNIDGAGNHNGSRLIIGPDNKLYITTGDASNSSTSQDINSLEGKILRMNLDGSYPDDNPYTNKYLWTFGHRNPQGIVFANDGKLYSSEHGPNNDDEINIIEKGRNYGWPNVAGFCDTQSETDFCNNNNVKEPLYAWTPTLAVCGIDYYDNTSIPEWQNSIIMTSLKDNTLYSLKLSQDGLSITETKSWFANTYGRLRDVCVAPDGRVFIATSNRDGRGSPAPDDDKIIEIKAIVTDLAFNKDNPRIKIYPVPLQFFTIIEVGKQLSNGTLFVYTAQGKLIIKDKLNDTKFVLWKDNLPKGIYLVRVEKEKFQINRTLLVL